MSAIAGICHFDGRPNAAAGCSRMLSALSIYGPDGVAQWDGGAVAFGRRLMRFTAEDAFDRQPVVFGNRHVLVADVRLDNRDDLAERLGYDRQRLVTASDAALLGEALIRWGEEALAVMRGAFAFALWDRHERVLLLGRDALGQRPLHFHRGNGFFALASMAKGLHALPEIPYAADEDRVVEMLALAPENAVGTFFKGIGKVPAGHVAVVTAERTEIRRWWWPEQIGITRGRKAAEWQEGMRHHLDVAVRRCLRDAGQVCATHLSAGLDSSVVAATAARQMQAENRRLVAFTAVPRPGYDSGAPNGRLADEGELAAEVAKLHPAMEHVRVHCGGKTPLDGLDRHFLLSERPLLNPCNMTWVDAINDMAHDRGIRVLLTGGMGNMTVSHDGMQAFAELLRAGRLPSLAALSWAALRGRHLRLQSIAKAAIGPWLPGRIWRRIAPQGGPELYTALSPGRLHDASLWQRARQSGLDPYYRPWRSGAAMRRWVLARTDVGNYHKALQGGWRLDGRDPTADLDLLSFCLSIPTEDFIPAGRPRGLARTAFADRLPPAVLASRLRGYQAADWHEGVAAALPAIREELARLAQCPEAARSLDLDRLRRLADTMPQSGWHRNEVIGEYRLALLRGLAAGHFLRRVRGGNA